MTATDELRTMLDERGMEWHEPVQMEGSIFTRWNIDGVCWTASMVHGRDNALRIGASKVTPEQAIAATLGAGTCHSTTPSDAWCFACSECGKSFPRHELSFAHNHGEINYCPNCGRRIEVSE